MPTNLTATTITTTTKNINTFVFKFVVFVQVSKFEKSEKIRDELTIVCIFNQTKLRRRRRNHNDKYTLGKAKKISIEPKGK
jgi:hypothetical protein